LVLELDDLVAFITIRSHLERMTVCWMVTIPDGLTRGIDRDMAQVAADHFPATVSIE